MARPLSEEKRIAILEAAVVAVATDGLGAPTAKIAKAAGVADGTLFVYFATKDDLLNQLYFHLKEDLRDAVFSGYPQGASIKNQFQHFWDRYIEWGSHAPEKHKALRQLSASEKLSEESRKSAWHLFGDIEGMLAEGFRSGALRKQPADFLGGIMDCLAGLVLERGADEPRKLDEYRLLGWSAFWGAISAG